jgi:hypothetical protein
VEWQFTLWAEDEDVEAAVQRLAEVRVRGIQRRAAVAGGGARSLSAACHCDNHCDKH